MSNSWYVEMLLRNREDVRRRATKVIDNHSYEIDFEDEDYANLLLVEDTIKSLIKERRVFKKELLVLSYILQHKTLFQIEQLTGMTRVAIVRIFENLCDRLSYILGDVFTNSGYLNFVAEKYNLTEEQIQKAKEYMESNKKNFVPNKDRRIYK